jgi:hypothetical protein
MNEYKYNCGPSLAISINKELKQIQDKDAS